MKSRVFLIALALLMGLAIAPNHAQAEAKKLPMVEANESGLYAQPWFKETFLDLKEDMAEAKAEGKQLVVFWEQKGCPYCRETHAVNLRKPKTVDYIKKHFFVVQLNLWGDREVVDVDGTPTTEKKLARKHRVQFTPTIQFFPQDPPKEAGVSSRDYEVWRLMGYWKPFHFHHTFQYVHEKGYVSQPNFQRWLSAVAEEYQAQGKEINLW
ncbi:MAG: thioredoxin fold domain-containing protein [Rhodospirillaceae bacterium]|jgi:thioredoxin-related protein|nr:thioredoxin fold domain-containing protein [Rhodospirillaceae bacterium]